MPLIIGVLALTAFVIPKPEVEKPEVFRFGAKLDEIKKSISYLSESIEERNIEPIQLPTAKESQIQLDVQGFMYAGKKRKAELIFADGILDMVWVLTTPEEEQKLISSFEKLYGSPTHKKEDVTFFLNDGVAVRNNPHEVLFISDRLKEPYRQFLESR